MFRTNYSVSTVKKILCPQQSLDRLKNASKPRKGVSPSTVYVSSHRNQNGNIKKTVCFTALFLCKFALTAHNAPYCVNCYLNCYFFFNRLREDYM